MKSTKRTTATCLYLGVDVTDRYANSCRAMDVCGLEVSDNELIPHFWTWAWTEDSSINVAGIVAEISGARAVMLDGPQGLARLGNKIRASERVLAAAGKTSDARPTLSQPYGGFVASSVDLFAAFHSSGLFDLSHSGNRLHEVYPAAIWTRLAQRLPNKRHQDGQQARAAILRALGIALPDALTHDQLDACVAALLGAAADERIQGIRVVPVGDRVFWDDENACLREGEILVPEVDPAVRTMLHQVVAPWEMTPAAQPATVARPAAFTTTSSGNSRTMPRPTLDGASDAERAAQLFELLLGELLAGRPTLCTYKAAVAIVLGFPKYTPAYGSMLLKLASASAAFDVDSLGEIRLDTFLVNQKLRPGEGHWASATYAAAEWDRAFSAASVIE